MTRRILIVDDDSAIRIALQDALQSANFAVATAESAVAALSLIGAFAPDVVVTDVRMPDMSGLELLQELRTRVPDTTIVLMTAFDDMPTVVEAMKNGATDFLVKPLDLEELQRTLERILADRALRRRASNGMNAPVESGSLVGRDPRMIEIYKLVGQAASNRATVLIRGESGTGKELVARRFMNTLQRTASRSCP